MRACAREKVREEVQVPICAFPCCASYFGPSRFPLGPWLQAGLEPLPANKWYIGPSHPIITITACLAFRHTDSSRGVQRGTVHTSSTHIQLRSGTTDSPPTHSHTYTHTHSHTRTLDIPPSPPPICPLTFHTRLFPPPSLPPASRLSRLAGLPPPSPPRQTRRHPSFSHCVVIACLLARLLGRPPRVSLHPPLRPRVPARTNTGFALHCTAQHTQPLHSPPRPPVAAQTGPLPSRIVPSVRGCVLSASCTRRRPRRPYNRPHSCSLTTDRPDYYPNPTCSASAHFVAYWKPPDARCSPFPFLSWTAPPLPGATIVSSHSLTQIEFRWV